MNEVLLELLNRLEAIGDAHEELFDTEVREAMDDAVFYGFIKRLPTYMLPKKFGMFTPEGDAQLQDVFAWFLPAACESAVQAKLDTFHKRLTAFQDVEIQTVQQNCYNDFFGWSKPELFDESGNVINQV